MKHREILERIRSRFNSLEVQRVGRRIDLEAAGATFATWHPRYLLTGYSWDAVAAGMLLGPGGPPRNALILGLAGGTVTRQLRRLAPQARLTGIEIDDAVIRLARRYMELDAQQVECVVDDAYPWLRQTSRRFDAIADDLFCTGAQDVHRPLRPTTAHIQEISRRLLPSGVLVANFIITGEHRAIYDLGVRSFQAVFKRVAEIIPPRGYNRILVGGNGAPPPHDLSSYRAAFSLARDRSLWDRLVVRSLT